MSRVGASRWAVLASLTPAAALVVLLAGCSPGAPQRGDAGSVVGQDAEALAGREPGRTAADAWAALGEREAALERGETGAATHRPGPVARAPVTVDDDDASTVSGDGLAPGDGSAGEAGDPDPVADVRPAPRHFPRRAPPMEDLDPAPAPVATVVVPAGSEIDVRLAGAVSSETSLAGDDVRAVVTADVVRGGVVAVPAGAELQGRIIEVRPAKKIGGRSRVVLGLDTLRIPGEPTRSMSATVVVEGKPQAGKDAATIGGATAGGALLGRILKRDDEARGTLIGAAVGAALGSAVAARNQADPVVLEPGAELVVVLEAPLGPVTGRSAHRR